jgi:transposase-like protein
VDEIKVKGEWLYQYRAVDSDGQTVEFFFSAKRDVVAAQGFFEKALGAAHTVTPGAINVDKHAVYPKAVENSKPISNCRSIARCARSNTSII